MNAFWIHCTTSCKSVVTLNRKPRQSEKKKINLLTDETKSRLMGRQKIWRRAGTAQDLKHTYHLSNMVEAILRDRYG